MNDTVNSVLHYLDGAGIAYRLSEHAPTADMAACAGVDARLHALTPKNIFLTTKNGRRFYLCLTRPGARFRTADISKQAGSPRLSFAPEEALYRYLRCRGGSASPLGLIFDADRAVGLLVDEALRGASELGFHPCDNRFTVAMAGRDFFETFLPGLGITPTWVEIHDFYDEA